MNTKFKVAQGKWIQSHREIPNDEYGMHATQVYTEDGETIATLSWYPKPKVEGEFEGRPVLITGTYREEHAILIADAGNTIQSCGLLPSELLKQNDDMRELLTSILNGYGNTGEDMTAFKNDVKKYIESTNP